MSDQRGDQLLYKEVSHGAFHLNLQVGTDGRFHQLTPTREIHGRFYGPGHAEVGGIFTHPEAVGAFGAKH